MVAVILIVAAYLGGLLLLLAFMCGADAGQDGRHPSTASRTFESPADDGETEPYKHASRVA